MSTMIERPRVLDAAADAEAPVALLCAHGTRDAAGQAVLADLRRRAAELLPGVTVDLCFVDVQQPAVGESVRRWVDAGRRVVVVPLLLSAGFHTEVDIARAVADVAGRAVALPPLGPDPLLVDILQKRLAQAGTRPGDPVVLAAVGSSRPQAAQQLAVVRAELAARRPGPVTVGVGAVGGTPVGEAVAAARETSGGRPVTVAGYLLAPGYFHRQLAASGADAVTAPLGADPWVLALVRRRYLAGCRALAGAGEPAALH